MKKVRTFLKQHALLVGGVAVAVPLLIIFYLQYRTLTTLGQTLPAYRKQVLGQYLRTVIEETIEYYYENGEKVLLVPAKLIEFQKGGVIQDNMDRTASLKAVGQVAEHFKQQSFKGANRYFIAVATERGGEDGSEVFFYDPASQTMIIDPKAPELVAINVACASYMVYIRAGSAILPYAMGIDRDPQHRLIVKPVYEDAKKHDEAKKIFAVAGMVLDQSFLMDTLVPEIIQRQTPKLLPTEDRDALVAMRSGGKVVAFYDSKGNKLKAARNEIEIEPEFLQPFYWIFQGTRLSIRLKDLTVGQQARRNYLINLSLWAVMATTLIVALGLILRTASREMKLTQMKADFVSNVSHELRTPLASIRVLAELLNLGRVKDPAKVLEYGGYIESEGRRLTQLINNILDFSRIESGNKAYHFEQLDLKEVVDETLEAFSMQLKRNSFIVDYVAPEKKLPDVILDPDAIALVLTNLLDNAMKYSRSEKKIDLRLGQKDDFVTLAVADKGIGIPREEHAKIFEKFYRVSTGLVHDVKGSGLGLSLVKHIVEAHQGKITVESEPGFGSTFTVHLPNVNNKGSRIDRASSERINKDDRTFSAEVKV